MGATLYKQSGDVIKVQPQNGTDFTLEELQGYVGGYIEVLALNDDLLMVINEEGKFDEALGLNPTATNIAIRSNAINYDDYIVGDVLVCHDSMIK